MPFEYGEDQTHDWNNIESLMYLHHGLNTFKMARVQVDDEDL